MKTRGKVIVLKIILEDFDKYALETLKSMTDDEFNQSFNTIGCFLKATLESYFENLVQDKDNKEVKREIYHNNS